MTRTLTALLAFALLTSPILAPTALAAKKTASFTATTLSTLKKQPTVTGVVTGYSSVYVTVKDAKGKLVYRSKVSKVSKEKFSFKVKKDLKPGTYTVRLYDKNKKFITKNALTVRSATAGSIIVSGVPLLFGGAVAAGGSIPVAYVQVRNSSVATTTLKGVDLVEKGPGSGEAVTGFITSDNLGGSRTTVGSASGSTQFKDGKAFVPLVATIAPGTTRLFTIKAIIGTNPGEDRGKVLMIDVAGVQADGIVNGKFPIAGTAISVAQ